VPAAEPSASSAVSHPGTAASPAPIALLVVDDERVNVVRLERILQQAGYRK
jgi:PleD family two-component response regulator